MGKWREEQRRDGKASLPREKVARSGSLSRENVGLSENREFKVRSRVMLLHVILASSRLALMRIEKEMRFFPANRQCSRKLMF